MNWQIYFAANVDLFSYEHGQSIDDAAVGGVFDRHDSRNRHGLVRSLQKLHVSFEQVATDLRKEKLLADRIGIGKLWPEIRNVVLSLEDWWVTPQRRLGCAQGFG